VWKSQRVESSGGSATAATRSTGFEIGYLYEVDGNGYSGETLTLGVYEESETTAQSLLDAFPVGRKITIFYDPVEPQRSVVWRGKSNVALIARFVGAGFVVMSLASVYWFLRLWRLR